MKSQVDGAWQLYRALGEIGDDLIAEASRGLGKGAEDETPKEKAGKKVVKFLPRVLLVAALAAIPASAMGDSSLLDTARAKTAMLELSNEDLQVVCDSLALQHITPGILSQLEPLQVNDDGLVYGFGSPVTDLATTMTDDGKAGYSYYKDWWGEVDDPPEIKRYKLTHTRSLPVYESDGKTLVGYFTFGWLWPPETPHIGIR